VPRCRSSCPPVLQFLSCFQRDGVGKNGLGSGLGLGQGEALLALPDLPSA
jgi:hypothetical protein